MKIISKELFRAAARYKLIHSVEPWCGHLEARNLSSHTYNEIQAENTYEIAKDFLKDAQKLIACIQEKL